jgi:mannose-6-phosphate isomerase-like protein (cupin superfamily)
MPSTAGHPIELPQPSRCGTLGHNPTEEHWTMKGFVTDIEQATLANEDYRRVLFTGRNTQLVLMTVRPGDEIGLETHEEHDQFIRVEAGTGTLLLGGVKHELRDGSAVVVPAGVEHNVINTSGEPLRLYTLYSPPEHPDGTVHKTKQDDHGH